MNECRYCGSACSEFEMCENCRQDWERILNMPEDERMKLFGNVSDVSIIALEQDRRVRLLEPLDDGKYQPGDTGYLHCWLRDGCNARDSWGVVFDKNGDDGHTIVRGTRPDGSIVLLVDVVEYLQIVTDAPECPAYFGKEMR